MKKFLIIAALPYVLLLTAILSILLVDITPRQYTASGSADYVCELFRDDYDKKEGYNWVWEYDCLIERSDRFSSFVEAYNRKPLKKREHIPNDKGGCDLDTLKGFQYNDKAYDLETRQSWIKACEDPLADKFAEWEERKARILDEAASTDLKLSYKTFNYFRIIISLLPPFLLFYLLYRFKNHVIPNKGESLIDWLQSQKKFRISMIIAFVIFVIPFGFLVEDILDEFFGRRGNVGFGLLWLSILTYPLITILTARFITTSKD